MHFLSAPVLHMREYKQRMYQIWPGLEYTTNNNAKSIFLWYRKTLLASLQGTVKIHQGFNEDPFIVAVVLPNHKSNLPYSVHASQFGKRRATFAKVERRMFFLYTQV